MRVARLESKACEEFEFELRYEKVKKYDIVTRAITYLSQTCAFIWGEKQTSCVQIQELQYEYKQKWGHKADTQFQ